MKWLNKISKIKKSWVLLSIVILIAIILRYYQLENIPSGLLVDEANKGYDAYSLLLTGKDQWGSFLPFTTLRGFGDYPPPVYHYLSIIPVFLFGLNIYSVRFISALSGVLSVIVIYFLGRKLFNERIGLLSAFSLAVFPWAIGNSRIALEANLALVFLLISLLLGLGAKGNLRKLIFSSIFLAFSAYTYSAYLLFSPISFLIIAFNNLSKKNLKYIAISLLVFILFLSPLILNKQSASVRFSQIGITTNVNSSGFLQDLNSQRGECLKYLSSITCRILDNKAVLFSGILIKNYISHFSFNSLYLNGNDTQYAILDKRGLDYIYNLPLLLLGAYFLLRKSSNRKMSTSLFALFLLSPLPDALTSDGGHTRASMMIPFLALFNGIGMNYVLTLISKLKNLSYRLFIQAFIVILIVFSIMSFAIRYFSYFPVFYSTYSQYGYEQLVNEVLKNKDSYNKIYITKHLNDTKQYIYYLFYTKYDPRKYQAKDDVSFHIEKDGWVSIDRIGNIYFVPDVASVTKIEKNKQNILIVSTPLDFHKETKPVFTIKDPLGLRIFEGVKLSDLSYYYNSKILNK